MNHDKKFFYTTIADQFDDLTNPYDLTRRLEIVFDVLLPPNLAGKQLLDVGCGTGWFSQWACERNAEVISLDVGATLLRQTMAKSQVHPVIGDAMRLPFGNLAFDIVLSSEVIEHTIDPAQAVGEMARVLKPEGILILTCPNRLWQWLVNLATHLQLRPFEGYEHFPSFADLESMITDINLQLDQHIGFHPWPFQIKWLWKWSQAVDKRFGTGPWGQLMINQAIRASKEQVYRNTQ